MATTIDPWFIDQVAQVVETNDALRDRPLHTLGAADLRAAKRRGVSDARLANLTGATEPAVRRHREALGVLPVHKTVDTCAGEFPARTPYHYSTYEQETEVTPEERARDRDPRRRAEPDRPGDRVRLRVRARGVRARGGGVRIGDGELEPRDGLHRLRHLEPAVLRAALARGRPGGVPRRAARRGDRAVRRADAAAARADAPGGGVHDLGDEPRGDRSGRGPGQVRGGASRARDPRTAARRGADDARGARGRRSDRVPGRGAALLRARRSRDGDRLRRRGARAVRPDGGGGLARSPRADRPLPRGRDRGRRRRGGRYRRRRVHRRGDGAHRGGGRPFRRLVVPDPARDALGRRARHDRGHRRSARAPPRGGRTAEPPARGQGRADLGARGEPARVADGAVRVEGYRRLARAGRDAGARRALARRRSAPTA